MATYRVTGNSPDGRSFDVRLNTSDRKKIEAWAREKELQVISITEVTPAEPPALTEAPSSPVAARAEGVRPGKERDGKEVADAADPEGEGSSEMGEPTLEPALEPVGEPAGEPAEPLVEPQTSAQLTRVAVGGGTAPEIRVGRRRAAALLPWVGVAPPMVLAALLGGVSFVLELVGWVRLLELEPVTMAGGRMVADNPAWVTAAAMGRLDVKVQSGIYIIAGLILLLMAGKVWPRRRLRQRLRLLRRRV